MASSAMEIGLGPESIALVPLFLAISNISKKLHWRVSYLLSGQQV